MNRKFHRIVFNAARGLRMVVQETARGTGRGARRATRFGSGVGAKAGEADARGQTSLARSTFSGANVDLRAVDESGRRGQFTLAGTTVDTSGTLTLEASQLVMAAQTTQTDTRHTSEGKDWFWQRAQGEGGSDPTANYVQTHAGRIVTNVDSVRIETGAKASIDALAKQPGMPWVDELRHDPTLAGKVEWTKVDDAVKNWDYKQQGMTPGGAAIVTLVVAYFTAGAASGWGAAAGEAAAVGAGEGVALAGGAGTFVSAGAGMAISGAVGGAVAAGVGALAARAAVAVIDNQGNLGHALRDLGSSQSVKSLLTAIATGGVLGGMNLNPNGLPTEGGGAQKFMTQLGQNLQAGLARAVIGTAINGGSLEDSLKANLKNALIDTAAAQGAFAIGNVSTGDAAVLDAFTNKVAHAVAGCAVGAMRTDSKAGCGAGAIGAAVGEMAAEAYGRRADTTQFASMIGGMAAALAGADAQGIGVASQAGANAAANNYLSHSPYTSVRKLVSEENARLTQACGDKCTQEDFTHIDAQMQKLESAATVVASGRVSNLTSEQATKLTQFVLETLPFYGSAESLAQLITGRTSVTGEETNRLWAALGLVPVVGGALHRVAEPSAELLSAVLRNNFYRDGGDPGVVQKMFESAAENSTHNSSATEVVLGRYLAGSASSYEQVAQARGATYFQMDDWGNVQNLIGADQMWNINRSFLDQQMAQGKVFIFTSDPSIAKETSFTFKEYQHIISKDYFINENKGMFYAIKK